jgi:hypothetical protein
MGPTWKRNGINPLVASKLRIVLLTRKLDQLIDHELEFKHTCQLARQVITKEVHLALSSRKSSGVTKSSTYLSDEPQGANVAEQSQLIQQKILEIDEIQLKLNAFKSKIQESLIEK